MELHDVPEEERCMKRGYQSGIVATAGQSLKIETSPRGDDVLAAECPAGKAWEISVNVCIKEVDA